MNVKCEQVRKNLPHIVTDDTHTDPHITRDALLTHLRGCPDCQREYELLWDTANMLENMDAPTPPPALLGTIQERIRHQHRQQHLAFFARPLAWCLDRLTFELSPRLVNGIALLFFLIASGVVVQQTLFTAPAPTPEYGLTAMERTRLQQVRVSPAPWAGIKDTSTEKEPTRTSQPVVITPLAPQATQDRFFSPAQRPASALWHTDTVTTGAVTTDTQETARNSGGGSVDNTSEKLTVFWNHIKTEL